MSRVCPIHPDLPDRKPPLSVSSGTLKDNPLAVRRPGGEEAFGQETLPAVRQIDNPDLPGSVKLASSKANDRLAVRRPARPQGVLLGIDQALVFLESGDVGQIDVPTPLTVTGKSKLGVHGRGLRLDIVPFATGDRRQQVTVHITRHDIETRREAGRCEEESLAVACQAREEIIADGSASELGSIALQRRSACRWGRSGPFPFRRERLVHNNGQGLAQASGKRASNRSPNANATNSAIQRPGRPARSHPSNRCPHCTRRVMLSLPHSN